jgi:signal transduction histidine kinase
MRLSELVRTGTFRLAVFFALAITLATSIVFLFVYWQVAIYDAEHLNVRLSLEVASAASESDDRLKKTLELRLTRDLRRIDYAALFEASGKLIYGNIKVLPPNIPVDGKTRAVDLLTVALPEGPTVPVLFAAAKRGDGTIVILGRSLYEVYALRQVVIRALLICIGPAILLALIVGIIFSRRGTQRLITINETIVRIMRGDLTERLPTRGRMDDINYVANAVNLMLDEIVRLLDQIKSVGDNIAHDLRTPLALSRMRLERTLTKPEPDQWQMTARQTLADLDHALATVTALLRISEVESGRRRSNFKPIDLAEICTNVFDLYEPLAEAKGVPMILEALEPVPIIGDFDLFLEAVANLVENAIKFTPPSREVRIIARMTDRGALIVVADEGPGVAPKDRAHIFKRFYRAAESRDLQGNGLGLSMAATIVEQHGLSLHLDENTSGARFIISTKQ